MTETVKRSPRMELLLRTAMQVVADQGLRGLTHRAVDRQAGLPEGTCSAYLRTRRALVSALTEYVAGQVTADVELLARDLSSCELADDRAVDIVTAFFLRWLEERVLLQARMELSLEASRDAELAAALADCRNDLVGVVESILVARGKAHGSADAETLVASLDGVLFGALPRPAATRPAYVRQSIEVLMAALG